MTIYEYLNISEKEYIFKRDYIKNPLKKCIKRKKGGLEYEKPFDDDLKYLYLTLNKSVSEINKIIGHKISDYLSKFNKRDYMKKPKISKEKLEDMLFNKKMFLSDIAKMFNYKSDQPIYDWINYYNIKYSSQRYIENKFNKEDLYKDYIIDCLGMKNELPKKYNSTYVSIKAVLEKFGLLDKKYQEERLKNERIKRNNNFKILYDKKLLIEYIKNNNINSQTLLAEKLGISSTIFRDFIKKYNLEKMFDYTKSSFEIEIKKLFSNFTSNRKDLLYPYEIDLFNEELNIGIEFNGNYWHSEKNKGRLYHQQKSLLAESKGIFLYHIFEYEWLEKKQQIINQLKNILQLNENTIYARKCVIKEVDNKFKKTFLQENHLQGNDNSSIKLGLYYNDELVSLMTFVKPRFNKKYEWELSRFCSKAGCNVIGGASKLFKYFIKNYNPSTIISYSNIAHTKGKLYELLGFKLKEIAKPNYVWSNGHKILSRYQCQKHKLLEQGFKGNTESEIMHDKGYYKIYDCGNKVWVWLK